jgi:hypothetical protein
MWKKYPDAMLRSRVIAEGVRAVFPGCLSGFYTTEEVQDNEPAKRTEKPAPEAVVETVEHVPEPAPAQVQAPAPGLSKGATLVPTHRQRVNARIVEEKGKLTEAQIAEIRTLFAAAGTTDAVLDEVEAKLDEFLQAGATSEAEAAAVFAEVFQGTVEAPELEIF